MSCRDMFSIMENMSGPIANDSWYIICVLVAYFTFLTLCLMVMIFHRKDQLVFSLPIFFGVNLIIFMVYYIRCRRVGVRRRIATYGATNNV
jgi:hypothetical protein